MTVNRKLCLIDSLSPFCIKKHLKSHINWSKVNYHLLEYEGRIRKKILKTIARQFEAYIKKISDIGYNAVSIDDLAHITVYDFYPRSFREKIRRYKRLVKNLMQISEKRSVEVFINTDVMFFNKYIKKSCGKNFRKAVGLLYEACEKLFSKFPYASGVIFRIGEADGIDVQGNFKSTIILKNARRARYFLHKMIPLFEKHGKKMIFRTWAVGGGEIGDLNWNKKTFSRVFGKFKSGNLIISMKYGEGDFFRYFEVNELFFASGHKKIIELQTRREYEGFGEFPNFIGWEYEKIIESIRRTENIEGISVWCQTGGWSSFKNFTYQKNTSFFNELNTFVTIKMFTGIMTANRAVREFLKYYRLKYDFRTFVSFLRGSDFVINNLLYDPCFGRLKLYFNRLRIPPLPHIFWDNVTLTGSVILVYNAFVENPEESLRLGRMALGRIKKMNALNKKLRIPYNEFFYSESFKLFYVTRKLVYNFRDRKFKENIRALIGKIRNYQKKFRNTYKFYVHINGMKHFGISKAALKLFIRNSGKYRPVDRLLFNPFTKILLILFYKSIKKNMPQFTDNQAMPVRNIF